jgi:hypothetical protein
MRKLMTFAALASGLAAALAGVQGAKADEQGAQCRDRDKVLAHLAGKYQEAPVAVGVTSTGGLVEVLSSGDGGTWTIIVTSPTGLSCLMAAGDGWRPLEETEGAGPEA